MPDSPQSPGDGAGWWLARWKARGLTRGRVLAWLPPLLVFGVLTCLSVLNAHPIGQDDQFITLRYAKNLSEGQGLVYNPGDRFLGTTTPLYALLLGLLGFFVPNLLVASIVVGVAANLGCAVVVYLMYRERRMACVGYLFGLFVVQNGIISASLGMEASLFCLLLLLAIHLYDKGNLYLAGFVCGLSFVCRPEGLFLAFVLCGWDLVANRRLRKGLYLGLASCVVPWLTFSLLYFGSLLPQTVGAKYAHGQTGMWPTFWEKLWTTYLARLSVFNISAAMGVCFAVISRRRPAVIALAFLFTYLLAYYITGVPPYIWYYVPVIVFLSILASEGIVCPLYLLVEGKRMESQVLKTLAILAFLGWAGNVVRRGEFPAWPALTEPARPDLYRLAQWIRENTPKNARVLHNEIGILGYYGDRTIIDPLGLANTGMLDLLRGNRLDEIETVFRPDYLVAKDGRVAGYGSKWRERKKAFHVVYRGDRYLLWKRTGPGDNVVSEAAVVVLPDSENLDGFAETLEAIGFASKASHIRDIRDVESLRHARVLVVEAGCLADRTWLIGERLGELNDAGREWIWPAPEIHQHWQAGNMELTSATESFVEFECSRDPMLSLSGLDVPLFLVHHLEVTVELLEVAGERKCQVFWFTDRTNSGGDPKKNRDRAYVNVPYPAQRDGILTLKVDFLGNYAFDSRERIKVLRFDPLVGAGKVRIHQMKLVLNDVPQSVRRFLQASERDHPLDKKIPR